MYIHTIEYRWKSVLTRSRISERTPGVPTWKDPDWRLLVAMMAIMVVAICPLSRIVVGCRWLNFYLVSSVSLRKSISWITNNSYRLHEDTVQPSWRLRCIWNTISTVSTGVYQPVVYEPVYFLNSFRFLFLFFYSRYEGKAKERLKKLSANCNARMSFSLIFIRFVLSSSSSKFFCTYKIVFHLV